MAGSRPGKARTYVRERILTIRELYQHGILDKADVAKAVLLLKLDPKEVASLFGYSNLTDFYAEFVDDVDLKSVTPEGTSTFETWNLSEMVKAVDLRYGKEQAEYSRIADELKRTYKSVQSWFRRVFKQGVVVNRDLWDLIAENPEYDVETLAAIADLPAWRVQFVVDIYKLAAYCTFNGYTKPIVQFD